MQGVDRDESGFCVKSSRKEDEEGEQSKRKPGIASIAAHDSRKPRLHPSVVAKT